MSRFLMHFRVHRESGVTMAEYALMLGLIALAVFAAVQAFGIAVNALFVEFPTLP